MYQNWLSFCYMLSIDNNRRHYGTILTIWAARNSKLTHRERNYYIVCCASVWAWSFSLWTYDFQFNLEQILMRNKFCSQTFLFPFEYFLSFFIYVSKTVLSQYLSAGSWIFEISLLVQILFRPPWWNKNRLKKLLC